MSVRGNGEVRGRDQPPGPDRSEVSVFPFQSESLTLSPPPQGNPVDLSCVSTLILSIWLPYVLHSSFMFIAGCRMCGTEV